jgi:hypothetical protein
MADENTLKDDWFIAVEDCFFRPGAGEPWEERRVFSKGDILNSTRNVFPICFFEVVITEKTSDSLKGYLNFESGGFSLDREHPVYSTGYINVAYDTNLRLTLELL